MSNETLDQNYARAGYHARQQWGKRPALILIDFARAYFEPESPLYGAEGCASALESARRLLKAARESGVPVIFTEVKYLPGGVDGGVFYRKTPPLACFEDGNPLQTLAEGLDVRDGEILITKQYPSAFFATSLAATLTAMGVDTAVLTGVTTSGCVRASCIDAMSHGFVTLVVEEAVGDRDPRPHEANLFDMSAKYADVIAENEAMAYFVEAGTAKTR